MNNIILGAAVLAVVALIEGLYYAVSFMSERQREDLQRRLQPQGGAGNSGPSLLRAARLSTIPVLDSLLSSVPVLDRLATLIEQAQVGGTVARLLVFMGLAGMVGAVVGLLLAGGSMAVALGITGAVIPVARLVFIREARSGKLSQQLPNALDMMARSLRAGHALTAAFKLVAQEMPSPINLEFARAYEEQNLGVSFERAVLQMTARAPRNRDLKIFAVSVIIQRETGGNLVEILEKLSDTIRERYRFYGKLAALTAEGKLSGLVLAGLPVATAFFLIFVKQDYILTLVTTAMGRGILFYAILSWLFGLLWLRQMSKVEL